MSYIIFIWNFGDVVYVTHEHSSFKSASVQVGTIASYSSNWNLFIFATHFWTFSEVHSDGNCVFPKLMNSKPVVRKATVFMVTKIYLKIYKIIMYQFKEVNTSPLSVLSSFSSIPWHLIVENHMSVIWLSMICIYLEFKWNIHHKIHITTVS